MQVDDLKKFIAFKVFFGRGSMIFGTYFLFQYLWSAQWVVAAMDIPQDSWIYLTVLIAASWVIGGLVVALVATLVLSPTMFRIASNINPWELKARFGEITALENRFFLGLLSVLAPLTGVLSCIQLVRPDGWPIMYLVFGSAISLIHFASQYATMEREL